MSNHSNSNSNAFFGALLEQHYFFNQTNRLWIRPEAASFAYSDGDAVEQQLLEIVQNATDLQITSSELRSKATGSWPVIYHLHPRRANLLRPVQHLLHGKILEVGAGCGAITRFLGEQGGEVLAVEGSERRATVAAARCRDLPNVTVVVDQFHQVPIAPQYDVVTLIGVLEYARLYFPCESGDAVNAMLARARQFLKSDGVLMVAIENQLGLKYFAGYPEDHTDQVMLGIEDRYTADGVITFGRSELARRLTASGLSEQRWWFPFPDYKLPALSLSEYLLLNNSSIDISPILSSALAADFQSPAAYHFSLELASQAIARNQLFGELANSFLVIAGRQKIDYPDNIIGYHYASDRRAEFNKVVIFTQHNNQVQVCSRLLYPQVVPAEVIPLTLVLPDSEKFVEGQQWLQKFHQIINCPDWTLDDLTVWAKVWLKAFLLRANLAEPPAVNASIPGYLLDALPRNLIIGNDSTAIFIDQEWQLSQPIEFGYLVFRALLLNFLIVRSMAAPHQRVPLSILKVFFELTDRLGIIISIMDVNRYISLESEITNWVYGIKSSGSLKERVELLQLPVRNTQAYVSRQAQDDLQVQALQQTIIEMKNSYSWRVTQPLRWLAVTGNRMFNKPCRKCK